MMVDPPWDIHMELPHGTMSYEEKTFGPRFAGLLLLRNFLFVIVFFQG